MLAIARLFTSICVEDVRASKEFFVALLDLHVHFEADWFVILVPGDNPAMELGIIKRDHALVPEPDQVPAQGVVLTFVVDDVEAVHARARAMGARVVQAPRDEFYGQRRLLVRSGDGVLIDISTPMMGAGA